MSDVNKLSVLILNEIVHDNTILFQRINLLMETLENKDDPNPEDVVLVDSIYQYLEKKKILEENLKRFTKKSTLLHKNKLEELLEDF
jgi:hypothetical protein